MREEMYEQRLMSIGFPFSEAFSVCRSLRKERCNLDLFVREQEQRFKNKKEAIR